MAISARAIDSLPKDRLEEFCRRWHLTELSFFGSVVRDDFASESDIDAIVDFAPGYTPGFSFVQLHEELAQILGRPVDVVTRRGLEAARRSARRSRVADRIAATATTVYHQEP